MGVLGTLSFALERPVLKPADRECLVEVLHPVDPSDPEPEETIRDRFLILRDISARVRSCEGDSSWRGEDDRLPFVAS